MKKLSTTLCALLCAASILPVSAADYLDRTGWNWKSSSICEPDGSDIAGLEGIYDGDASTCWHSNYHAQESSPERKNPHWVMIDRGKDAKPFYGVSYLPRQEHVNNTCTQYMIYVSNQDLSSTPSDNVNNIKSVLGSPLYEGTWEGNTDEKFCVFEKEETGRYILFVNVASYQSNSAACAEMNLLASKKTGGGGSSDHNAVKITPADGSEPHRIAIDGTNLNISMTGTAIHLTNSGITVEYDLSEVKNFVPEHYEFAENEFYVGTKTDIYDNPFDLEVTPAEGEIYSLSEITIKAAMGALPTVNPNCTENVKLHRGKVARRTISTAKMAEYATEDAYVISGLEETQYATYTLTIPEGFFLDSNGSRSNPLEVAWNLVEDPEQSAIEEVKDNCSTILMRRDGDDLILGGITSAAATLVNTAGVIVAQVPVSGHGVAIIPVGSLGRGVYLLNANNTTLKITL